MKHCDFLSKLRAAAYMKIYRSFMWPFMCCVFICISLLRIFVAAVLVNFLISSSEQDGALNLRHAAHDVQQALKYATFP
jgi:hypothetical protein